MFNVEVVGTLLLSRVVNGTIAGIFPNQCIIC
jgi:hypothetical protein